MAAANDIYNIEKILTTDDGNRYSYYSLTELERQGHPIGRLPFSIRILLENALRHYDGFAVTREHTETLLSWGPQGSDRDIPFMPARVLMQDFTGVPAVVDIAALRAALARRGKDPQAINPLIPVDLIIDHSVQVDYFGTDYALAKNIAEEYARNRERYSFLKWAQNAFTEFRVVPPGMGICHQVNLEYLSRGVVVRNGTVFPDSLVGTDSHTPMVNGIGTVAWGVGGIEAEAAILGQPIYFIVPQVIGLKLSGKLPTGVTATDLVLTLAEQLRQYGVVGKFVEVFGSGLDTLTVPDRATIGNMSPEFGCTITYFPIDAGTLEYMRRSGRAAEQVQLTEAYCKGNRLWRSGEENIAYTDVVELDLSTVEPVVAGPRRPHDKIRLKDFKHKFIDLMAAVYGRGGESITRQLSGWFAEGGGQPVAPCHEPDSAVAMEAKHKNGYKSVWVDRGHEKFEVSDGSIAIAAITSCTNTSNPWVMIGAGLVARKARERGINVRPWVKTSLAPGSKVVTAYLQKAGLLSDLEALGFHLVGYGCTSCIGNSGPLPGFMAKAVDEHDIVVASVLSGNRNFEARIHPQVRMNFLMSPMLVVAFAIAGRIDIDLVSEPLAFDKNRQPVYLNDIRPGDEEILEVTRTVVAAEDFKKNYGDIFAGNTSWQTLDAPTEPLYAWDEQSTYIKEVPFFADLATEPEPLRDITGARALLVLGDSITTDHISPAGRFNEDSPAGRYLLSRGIAGRDFNSYGSRRGNDEVMVRGTFANVRLANKLTSREGGYTVYLPTGETMSVYDAAVRYRANSTPLLVLAGKEYGSGSSRDWAAKGTALLGVKAVLAESYERIHRSNLVGMGVLPLQYKPGENAATYRLSGREIFSISGLADHLTPLKPVEVTAEGEDGTVVRFEVIARVDSPVELAYYRNGGILPLVLRRLLQQEDPQKAPAAGQ